MEEVSKHNTKDKGIWVAYQNNVQDITKQIKFHPGGDMILKSAGGKLDEHFDYWSLHLTSEKVKNTLPRYKIGIIANPYNDEPIRNKNFIINTQFPYNGEPLKLEKSFITKTDEFFIRNHSPTPNINQFEYKLNIINSKNKHALKMDNIKQFKEHDIISCFQCTANRISELHEQKLTNFGETNSFKNNIGNAKWTGILLYDVLQLLFNQTDLTNKHIEFESQDGFRCSIAFNKINERRVLLAYKMNDELLTRDHGYPLRIIVPGMVGAKSVKWIKNINIIEEESDSPWQKQFQNRNGKSIKQQPVNSIITTFDDQDKLKLSELKNNKLNVQGIAYSGNGYMINSVQISVDNGNKWLKAELYNGNNKFAWTLWNIFIDIDNIKTLDIWCKAVDELGTTQKEDIKDVWKKDGQLNNCIHKVKINIID